MPATPQQCREYRQRLKKRVALVFGIVCQTCGGKRKVQLAHVKPTELKGAGRGLTARMLDALKNPDAYCLLCVKCHRKLDWAKSEVENERSPF